MKTVDLKNMIEKIALIKSDPKHVWGRVKLEKVADRLIFSFTNLEEYFIGFVLCEGPEFGCTVEFKPLVKAVKALKCADCSVEFTPEKLYLTGDMKYIIPVMNVDLGDYVEFPVVVKGSAVGCSLETLNHLVKRVGFSTTEANVNKAYAGILFNPVVAGKVDVVTTDIHRLTVVKTDMIKLEKDFVVPVSVAKTVCKMFRSFDGFHLGKTEAGDCIIFSDDCSTYHARTLVNEFPQYQRVLSVPERPFFTIDKKKFIEVLTKITSFSDAKVIAGKFNFNAYTSVLDIVEESISGSLPVSDCVVDAKIGLNVSYVLEYVKTVESSVISMKFDDGLKPCYFIDNTPDLEVLHLIMPLRV